MNPTDRNTLQKLPASSCSSTTSLKICLSTRSQCAGSLQIWDLNLGECTHPHDTHKGWCGFFDHQAGNVRFSAVREWRSKVLMSVVILITRSHVSDSLHCRVDTAPQPGSTSS